MGLARKTIFILLKQAVALVQRRSSLLNLMVAINFHGLKSSHLQCVKAVMVMG